MRVLVACEFSGVVRDAFIARGHDAWSCDLLPTEKPGPHLMEDAIKAAHTTSYRDQLWRPRWDLLIAHPPCTALAVSGARWFKDKVDEQRAALQFVYALMHAPIPRICIENPISVISSRIRKPDQIVQPWYFGDDASKATCLWLKGLPPLQPCNPLPGNRHTRRANQTASGQNKLGPSPTRAADRARTYPGFAAAMAEQWGA